MNAEIRSQFPATEKYAYLNSAAMSPLPGSAVEAIQAQMKDSSENGVRNFMEWVATKTRTRDLLAGMLHVRAEQIAFMRNVSDGISSVANGLKWNTGENIVTFAREFPANYYAWRRVRDEFGVELRLCPERDGGIEMDEFIDLIDSNTRLVSISAVQYASGFKADLERIGNATRKVDALFCVDIIQGFGAMPFDLPAQLIDVACGGGHKWLCGPEGCGFLYLSDRARERIEPTLIGWISVETPWDFEDREQCFKPNALAWESGTGPSSLYYGLEQSLKLLNHAGLENIERYLAELTDYMCDRLRGMEYDVISSRKDSERSAIVCIKHRNGLAANEVVNVLERADVIVSPRGDRVRIAPHFYNDREDIDRLIEALP